MLWDGWPHFSLCRWQEFFSSPWPDELWSTPWPLIQHVPKQIPPFKKEIYHHRTPKMCFHCQLYIKIVSSPTDEVSFVTVTSMQTNISLSSSCTYHWRRGIYVTILCLTQQWFWCKQRGGEFASSHATWLVERNLHMLNVYKVYVSFCNTVLCHQLIICVLSRMLKINSWQGLINS
jgi:hypothetical protein